VSQDRPISSASLREARLRPVQRHQLVDRLETVGLVKRADDPSDRGCPRGSDGARTERRRPGPGGQRGAQDVANKLAAVDSQKLKRALDAIQ